jgi:hypothetical protein
MSDTEARASGDATPDEPSPDQPAAASVEHPVQAPVEHPVQAPVEAPADGAPEDEDPGPPPSWWHRSHPTFAGLVGFFSGVAYVIIIPGVYATILGLLLSDSAAQRLFPLVLVALVIPLAMLVPRKTRRFAQFMFLGIISTALVIAATTALVIWVMVRVDG